MNHKEIYDEWTLRSQSIFFGEITTWDVNDAQDANSKKNISKSKPTNSKETFKHDFRRKSWEKPKSNGFKPRTNRKKLGK